MPKKNYTKSGDVCRVTFKLPAEVQSESAALVGEFNEWNPEAAPMRKLKNGEFSVTVSLETGRSYRYRYLLDAARWDNDWSADGDVGNEFGTEDSIIKI